MAPAVGAAIEEARRAGFAFADAAVAASVLAAVSKCLAATTVWFGVNGLGATARLLDGLHRVEPVLSLARTLAERLSAPLLDIVATRHCSLAPAGASGAATDAAFVAAWMAGSRPEDTGFRILEEPIAPSVPWAVATAAREAHLGLPVSYVPGRLLLWRGERVVSVDASPSAGLGEFSEWRVDVLFYFGPRQPWPRSEAEREVNY